MRKRNKRGFVENALYIIIFIPCILIASFTSSFTGLLAFLIFSYINIYIHEIGHALAGKLAGLKIRSIVIGNGKTLWEKKIFNVLFVLNIGSIGFTIATTKDRRFIRLRTLICTLGGVLMNLLVTVPVFLIYGFEIVPDKVNIPLIFTISNLAIIIYNLFPMNLYNDGKKVPNDGLSLLKIPFMKEGQIEEIFALDDMFEAFNLMSAREYRLAKETYKNCIDKLPISEAMYIDYSVCLMKCLELEDAKDILFKLVEQKQSDEFDYLIYNNLAWICLLIGNEESLSEALQYAETAFNLDPDSPMLQNTRACILIESRETDKGIEILKKCNESTNPTDYMYLAYAYYQKGGMEEVKKYLKRLEEYLPELESDDKLLYERLRGKSNNFKV